jgi:hypothetical protein
VIFQRPTTDDRRPTTDDNINYRVIRTEIGSKAAPGQRIVKRRKSDTIDPEKEQELDHYKGDYQATSKARYRSWHDSHLNRTDDCFGFSTKPSLHRIAARCLLLSLYGRVMADGAATVVKCCVLVEIIDTFFGRLERESELSQPPKESYS